MKKFLLTVLILFSAALCARLRLWPDTNHDGVSQTAESQTLASLGISALHLDYGESKRVDEQGNQFRYRVQVSDAKDARVSRLCGGLNL